MVPSFIIIYNIPFFLFHYLPYHRRTLITCFKGFLLMSEIILPWGGMERRYKYSVSLLGREFLLDNPESGNNQEFLTGEGTNFKTAPCETTASWTEEELSFVLQLVEVFRKDSELDHLCRAQRETGWISLYVWFVRNQTQDFIAF